jgi:hypothetical protein
MPEPYVPLRGRAKAVTVVFAGLLLLYAVAVWSGLLELRLVSRLVAGTQVSEAEINASDSRQQLIGLIVMLGWVAGGIAFIGWLNAAYRNIDVVAPGERRFSDSWAIFAWFVPFLSFVRPKAILNDVWRAGGTSRADGQPGGVLTVWWLLWLANIVLNISATGNLGGETAEEIKAGVTTSVAADFVALACAMFAIALVRMATDRLDDKAAALPGPPLAPEPDFAAPERPAGVPA